jgi:hypothetical protein
MTEAARDRDNSPHILVFESTHNGTVFIESTPHLRDAQLEVLSLRFLHGKPLAFFPRSSLAGGKTPFGQHEDEHAKVHTIKDLIGKDFLDHVEKYRGGPNAIRDALTALSDLAFFEVLVPALENPMAREMDRRRLERAVAKVAKTPTRIVIEGEIHEVPEMPTPAKKLSEEGIVDPYKMRMAVSILKMMREQLGSVGFIEALTTVAGDDAREARALLEKSLEREGPRPPDRYSVDSDPIKASIAVGMTRAVIDNTVPYAHGPEARLVALAREDDAALIADALNGKCACTECGGTGWRK